MAGNDIVRQAVRLAEEVAVRARSSGKSSLFGLTCTANQHNSPVYFSVTRDTKETAGCSAVFRDTALGPAITEAVDGLVDYLLVDVEPKIEGWTKLVSRVLRTAQKSAVLTYAPNDLTALAVDALIAQLGVSPDGRPLAIIGAGHVGGRIAQRLVERGHLVRLWRRNPASLTAVCGGVNALRSALTLGIAMAASDAESACIGARLVIGCTPGTAVITEQMVQHLPSDAIILDVGNGTLTPEAIARSGSLRLKVLCCDFRAAYEAAVAMLLRTAQHVSDSGRRQIGEATLISGGVLGRRGDILVDNYAHPTQIIGVADGHGDVIVEIDSPEWQSALVSARREISRYRAQKK